MKSIYFLLFFVCITLVAEGCRPPRCRIPTCYVRMKHRHDSGNMKTTETNTIGRASASTNLGQEFRGVPFWERNKNPKIGEGYKPGYKYNYKKGKPRKPKLKKQKQVEEKIDKKQEQAGEEILQEEKPAEKKGLLKRKKNIKESESQEEGPVGEPAEQPSKKVTPPVEKDGF